jgi:hypothetical protein
MHNISPEFWTVHSYSIQSEISRHLYGWRRYQPAIWKIEGELSTQATLHSTGVFFISCVRCMSKYSSHKCSYRLCYRTLYSHRTLYNVQCTGLKKVLNIIFFLCEFLPETVWSTCVYVFLCSVSVRRRVGTFLSVYRRRGSTCIFVWKKY